MYEFIILKPNRELRCNYINLQLWRNTKEAILFSTVLLTLLYLCSFTAASSSILVAIHIIKRATGLRTMDMHWYTQTGCDQVQLMMCSSRTGVWECIICFSRCSSEVQLIISFGLTCCNVLLGVQLFYQFRITNSGGRCLSAIILPVHDTTRLWNAPARLVRQIRIHIRV
jgi:hypothetical protein